MPDVLQPSPSSDGSRARADGDSVRSPASPLRAAAPARLARASTRTTPRGVRPASEPGAPPNPRARGGAFSRPAKRASSSAVRARWRRHRGGAVRRFRGWEIFFRAS